MDLVKENRDHGKDAVYDGVLSSAPTAMDHQSC